MTVSFDFQPNKPVFVRSRHHPFTWKGKTYSYNQQVPWNTIDIPEGFVRTLFKTDKLYHNEALEAKHQVGDRLAEFEFDDLTLLIDRINTEVKKRTNSTTEYTKYRIPKGKGRSAGKLRGNIRSWLCMDWGRELFFEKRDQLLEERVYKASAEEQPVQEDTATEE